MAGIGYVQDSLGVPSHALGEREDDRVDECAPGQSGARIRDDPAAVGIGDENSAGWTDREPRGSVEPSLGRQ